MACDFVFGLKGLGYGSRLPRFGAVSLGKTLHLYVQSPDPGVNGYLVGQLFLVCLNSYQRRDGSRAVYFPRELSWYWNEQVLQPGNIDVKRIEILPNVAL